MEHRIPLDRTGWAVWRDIALRSAGFPATELDPLCDPELAAAADRADRAPDGAERYHTAYLAATARLTAAVGCAARNPRLREAIAWQNPVLVRTCLDKAARGEPRNVRGRNHELAIASYLQRYTHKNDTVGFFGPVGWARADPAESGLRVRPGPALLRRRTTYFEVWAIDALATAIAARDVVQPWLAPRRDAGCSLSGRVLRLPLRKPVRLSDADAELLRLCDGVRTTHEVLARVVRPGAFDGRESARAALLRLRDVGAVRLDLLGPMHGRPEELLRERLERIADPAARSAALPPLLELVAARDAVDTAAGDAEKVLAATEALGESFRRLAGAADNRHHGRVYAGRTLLYQDAVRDVEVRIGRGVWESVAPPLGIVLDSARWLCRRVGERYHELFLRHFAAQSGPGEGGPVRLSRLLVTATPDLVTPSLRVLPPPVAEVVAEFQQRWQRLLNVPAGARRHRVDVGAVAALARELFPSGPARWTNARQHSPDIMLAAADEDAVRRGDFVGVLGELHLAVNTLESRLFVEQHDEPGRLLAAAEADAAGRRIYAVQRRSSPFVTSRLSPPTALPAPGFTYWTVGDEALDCPVPPLPAADLDVHLLGDRLVVRLRDGSREFDFLETIGEILTATVANAFRPLPDAGHRPRITLDRLVLCRESWTVAPADAGWAFRRDERDRYAAARAWRAGLGIPERAFVRVPVEDKPSLVDFTSLALVNLLAKAIRRTAEAGAGGTVTLSELLPGPGGLWLRDADGNSYTSELRIVAVDRSEDGR